MVNGTLYNWCNSTLLFKVFKSLSSIVLRCHYWFMGSISYLWLSLGWWCYIIMHIMQLAYIMCIMHRSCMSFTASTGGSVIWVLYQSLMAGGNPCSWASSQWWHFQCCWICTSAICCRRAGPAPLTMMGSPRVASDIKIGASVSKTWGNKTSHKPDMNEALDTLAKWC
jgi:hypothetical protein